MAVQSFRFDKQLKKIQEPAGAPPFAVTAAVTAAAADMASASKFFLPNGTKTVCCDKQYRSQRDKLG